MEITFDKMVEYKEALKQISNEQIRNEIFTILEGQYKTKEKKPKNTSLICQLDDETFEVIKKYKTFKEVNEALGKQMNSSSVADATRGRNKRHFAYGYRWARENELDEILEILKSEGK